jgi:hypothetical protein
MFGDSLFKIVESLFESLWGLLKFKTEDKTAAAAKISCVIALISLIGLAVTALILYVLPGSGDHRF